MRINRTQRNLTIHHKYLGWLPWGAHGETIMRQKIENLFGKDVLAIVSPQRNGEHFERVVIFQEPKVALTPTPN